MRRKVLFPRTLLTSVLTPLFQQYPYGSSAHLRSKDSVWSAAFYRVRDGLFLRRKAVPSSFLHLLRKIKIPPVHCGLPPSYRKDIPPRNFQARSDLPGNAPALLSAGQNNSILHFVQMKIHHLTQAIRRLRFSKVWIFLYRSPQ